MQTVFIGDVHGCAEELDRLVELVQAEFGGELAFWLVGDLVNRGPDSLAVLGRVRSWVESGRATVVLGNHEIALLAVAFGLARPRSSDRFGELLADPAREAWIDWLRRQPLAEPGRLGRRRFLMVHAAVPPTWSFEAIARRAQQVHERLSGPLAEAKALLAADPRHDPDRELLEWLVSVRSVESDGRGSERQPDGGREPWHRAWGRHGHDYGLVYGHWARQGLHVAPGLRGLDTGCVHHGRTAGREGRLTAWIPDLARPDPFELPDPRFRWVRARHPYARLRAAPPRSIRDSP